MKKPIRMCCLSLSALMALSAAPVTGLQQASLFAPAVYAAAAADEWQVGKLYQQGDLVSYQGKLYKCRQGHTTVEGWVPSIVPALWLPAEDVTPEVPDVPEVPEVPDVPDVPDVPEVPDVIQVSTVKLSKKALNLKEGASAVLKAKVLPANATDKTVTWATSDSAVADVADGTVTAKAAGTAVITATAGDKTASCTVTVTAKEAEKPVFVAVESVSVTPAAAELQLGKKVKLALNATVLPANATDKTVTWATSDSAVADVADGLVTAKAAGTVVITAKAGDKTTSCTITVKEKEAEKPAFVAVESVKLLTQPQALELGKTVSQQLKVSVLPANATDKTVTWSSSDNAVLTVSANGLVTAKAAGTAVVTAKAGDKSVSCTFTVAPAKEEGGSEDTEHKEPPVPFWKDYKNYAAAGTQVYYKGKIYKNKWYANAGFTPDKGDPWVMMGPAEWVVPEKDSNYQKDEGAASASINKVLTDAEILALYGGINPDYSPEAALHRLEELIPESAYNELFPYRFGSPAWKAAPSTKNYYPNADEMPDYYSYDNLQKAVSTLSGTIIKVQWYEGAEWCYRLIRLDKQTKQQKLIYSDPYFDAEWLQSKTLCTSVCDYGSFLAVGDLNTRKRELAGFLANISHETGGGTVDGLTDDSKSGLYFNEEVGFIGSSAIGYVQGSGTSYLPVAGKSYHGRGPIQLSYNYNYGLCSDVLFGDSSKLLNDPDLIEQDGVLGFMTGIWFWMTPQPPKPSCHQVITGIWEPNSPDAPNAEFNGNFGLTIIIINNEAGQSEHGTGAVARRAKYYRIFSAKMGADITGEHCDTMGMGTFTQTAE